MTKAIVFTGSAMLLLGSLIILIPASTHAAAAPNAFLGGGNALSRGTSGESQGLTNANSSSDILTRLTFASTKGGRPAETPPAQDDEEDTTAASLPENANENAQNNANGNAQGGNGGNGGTSAPGGLIRAGSTVSNSTAVNAINTNIVRINLRNN